jgi:hypothetical protein
MSDEQQCFDITSVREPFGIDIGHFLSSALESLSDVVLEQPIITSNTSGIEIRNCSQRNRCDSLSSPPDRVERRVQLHHRLQPEGNCFQTLHIRGCKQLHRIEIRFRPTCLDVNLNNSFPEPYSAQSSALARRRLSWDRTMNSTLSLSRVTKKQTLQ